MKDTHFGKTLTSERHPPLGDEIMVIVTHIFPVAGHKIPDLGLGFGESQVLKSNLVLRRFIEEMMLCFVYALSCLSGF
jgi:hypothetical protein